MRARGLLRCQQGVGGSVVVVVVGEWNKNRAKRGSSAFVPSHSCGKRSPDMISHPFNFGESAEKSRSSLGGFLVLATPQLVVSLSQQPGHTSVCVFFFSFFLFSFCLSAEPSRAKIGCGVRVDLPHKSKNSLMFCAKAGVFQPLCTVRQCHFIME